MTTGNIDHLTAAKQPSVSNACRPEELKFCEASLSSAGGVPLSHPRRADILGAVEQIMGTGAKGIATQALGFGATVAAAAALISGGVPATVVGPAALAGAAASVLNPSKGRG